jgi:hypothetical protein
MTSLDGLVFLNLTHQVFVGTLLQRGGGQAVLAAPWLIKLVLVYQYIMILVFYHILKLLVLTFRIKLDLILQE